MTIQLPQILVVDDLPANRELLVELLDPQKYRIVEAADGAAALQLAPTSIGPLLVRAEREFEKRYRALTLEEER